MRGRARAVALVLLVVAGVCGPTSRARAGDEVAAVFPFVLPWDDASGGVTDASAWLPRPAGAGGPVRAGGDGHFYVGSDRIRFLGVNVSFAGGLPAKADAARIAARMARFGINVVRFHHLDTKAWPEGLRKAHAEDTGTMEPEALDRLDYFVAQLARRGIYTNLNLLVGRPFDSGDGLPAQIEDLDWKDRSIVGFFDARQRSLQQDWARALLTHRNPYTQKTYAEDPAVAFVEIINEQGLIHAWLGGRVDALPEVFRRELQSRWNAWLARRRGEPARAGGEQDARSPLPCPDRKSCAQRTAAEQDQWMRFLADTEADYWQAMIGFLKVQLKVKALVGGTIVGCSTPNLMAKMDWVDSHAYWQHPKFPGREWDAENWTIENRSMVNERGGVLPGLALKRVLGKPHAVTEYNHVAPDTYSSEAFVLLAAYASLQDWDAIYAYAYAHSRLEGWNARMIMNFFDIDQHPAKMATMVAAAAMFLRGDVEPARSLVAAALPRQREIDLLRTARAWTLVDGRMLGVRKDLALVHRLALATEGATVPAGALSPAQAGAPGDRIESDSHQLVWDLGRPGRGVVTVDAPRSKAVVGYGGGRRFELGGFVVEPEAGLQDGWSTITLTRMSDAPERWLLTATGYADNTGMKWKDASKTSVGRQWGHAPSRVEGVPARLTLPWPDKKAEVWSLDERGQRRERLPLQGDDRGGARVAIGPRWRTLWYEIDAK